MDAPGVERTPWSWRSSAPDRPRRRCSSASSANAPELLAGRPLRVHLVDPHRAGTGRVWRPDLHPLLWMNSMAEDVTMFTDDSVHCAGPIRPGRRCYEWAAGRRRRHARRARARRRWPPRSAGYRPMTFPTRLVQSVYLDWFHRQVLASLPADVEVVAHDRRAVDVRDERRRHASGWSLDGVDEPLVADVVVLALGHLDAEPATAATGVVEFAAAHGLVHLPAGHTAEQDLSVLEPGDDVIALGFGQAFTDLVVLVTEGRGGRFVDARRRHARATSPSGREPVAPRRVAPRRAVPLQARLPPAGPAGAVAAVPRRRRDRARCWPATRPLEFRRDVLPLAAKEVGWAYYHELFIAHRERTTCDVGRRSPSATPPPTAATSSTRVVASSVPDPADRFDLGALDRPLAGLRFDRPPDAPRPRRRATSPPTSPAAPTRPTAPTSARSSGCCSTFGTLGRIGASGRVAPRSRVDELGGWWFCFFMYYASGPPPARLRQLLALADAGLLRFIGADIDGRPPTPIERRFVARSTSHPDGVVGTGRSSTPASRRRR